MSKTGRAALGSHADGPYGVIAMRERSGYGINAITCRLLVFIYNLNTYQTIVLWLH